MDCDFHSSNVRKWALDVFQQSKLQEEGPNQVDSLERVVVDVQILDQG